MLREFLGVREKSDSSSNPCPLRLLLSKGQFCSREASSPRCMLCPRAPLLSFAIFVAVSAASKLALRPHLLRGPSLRDDEALRDEHSSKTCVESASSNTRCEWRIGHALGNKRVPVISKYR